MNNESRIKIKFQCSCEPLLDFLILLDVLVYKSCYVMGWIKKITYKKKYLDYKKLFDIIIKFNLLQLEFLPSIVG